MGLSRSHFLPWIDAEADAWPFAFVRAELLGDATHEPCDIYKYMLASQLQRTVRQ